MNLFSLADIVKCIIETENIKLKNEDVTHPTTIGEMYEGLTKEWVSKLELLNHFKIQIYKNSFVDGCSTEYDLILTRECNPIEIPYTGRYKISPKDIIAIFSITKTLYMDKIFSSIDNLKSSNEDFLHSGDLSQEQINIIEHSINNLYRNREITQEAEDKMLLETIKLDAMMPLRFIIGYNSFSSESSLREHFIEKLEKLVNEGSKLGYGPFRFPNLIICDKFSILKSNTMPYSPTFDGKQLEFLVTSPVNPLIFLLEILFTRLSYLFDNFPQDVFNDYYEEYPLHPFISAEPLKGLGWKYNYHDIDESQFNKTQGELREKPPY
ncbi:MAG: hypothetical protein E6Q32_08185 [Neisseriales bacterium]|nr:MAG: hypothetical protein E6Q32_08185 [Neisseriales bacterium]